ncbi:MAG: protease complex subunit PrcB family protein [Lachnospiraceae bacterium]|nr:protease complex subunit PrcB family protein [Lachnospiraceae bacterium]
MRRKCKQAVILLCACVLFGLISGCSVEQTDGNKLEDLAFTIVEEEAIPDELKTQIESRKEMDFKLAYENGDKLYIVRGYGEKETGGYSIAVTDVYLTKNAVCFSSTLIGPGENEEVTKAPSFPYVVVEVSNYNKNVVFL